MGDMQGVQGTVGTLDNGGLFNLMYTSSSEPNEMPCKLSCRLMDSDEYDERAGSYSRVVSAVSAGCILRLVESNRSPNRDARIKNLGDGNYMVCSSGEVRKYAEHGDTRAEDVASLKRTFQSISDIVNANAQYPERLKWLTLTYDPKVCVPTLDDVLNHFRLFNKSVRRWEKRNGKARHEYIAVLEPQGSGIWHLHVIMVWLHVRAPFIPREVLEAAWSTGRGADRVKLGFINVHKCDCADNLGLYLCSYLGNIELGAGESAPDGCDEVIRELMDPETGKMVSKRFAKGARLHFYPKGVKILRHSMGVRMPKKVEVSRRDLERIRKEYQPKYSSSREIVTPSGYRALYRHSTYNIGDVGTVVRDDGKERLDWSRHDVMAYYRDRSRQQEACYGADWRYLGLGTGDD